MRTLRKLKNIIFGCPKNPLDKNVKKSIALTALFAWIGLGADGLSSSCYGPEQAFLALGSYTPLALILAFGIMITVFIIAYAYNQVIELFPNGGGGYKVATTLLGPYAGLLAGCALIIDYILTIVISIASGANALFSFLPNFMQPFKISIEAGLIFLLILLNIRGMKESIKVLLPIFFGFLISHLFMIIYGITAHGSMIQSLFHDATQEIHAMVSIEGVIPIVAILIHAYSLGGGTYTGLEAVSNNVNTLAEPRVSTGKWTMFYMALSLSFTAFGIILLYLLWHVTPHKDQTLNAIAFRKLLGSMPFAHPILIFTLVMEAGLLFISANTGFLGGPTVLANMAVDQWFPKIFRNLSSRLVTQNGIIMFGIAALLVLFATDGHVAYIVILYTINVFIAFSISLFGLCIYWWQQRKEKNKNIWLYKLILAITGCSLCSLILLLVTTSQFMHGGAIAIIITLSLFVFCLFINQHYTNFNAKLKKLEQNLPIIAKIKKLSHSYDIDHNKTTAVFFVDNHRWRSIDTIKHVEQLFPRYFNNYIFVCLGIIDVANFGITHKVASMKRDINNNLRYLIAYAQELNKKVDYIIDYTTDPVEKLKDIAINIEKKFSKTIFFSSKIISNEQSYLSRHLHNQTALSLQQHLCLEGIKMVILPFSLEENLAELNKD